MANRLQIHWPRILAEGAAIVISILLAFWIQAWWDERQERSNEVIVLQSLLDDLLAKQEGLERDRKVTRVILESGTKLVNAWSDDQSEMDDLTVDRLIGNLLWYNAPSNWESATLNSVLGSSSLTTLSNASLVQALVSLQGSMERVKTTFLGDEYVHKAEIVPFLQKNADLVQILLTVEGSPSGAPDVYSFPGIKPKPRRSHRDLLVSDEFRNLVINKMDVNTNMTVFDYPVLETKLSGVIQMLEAELAND